MFDQLFKSSRAIARHATAPYAQERIRYLDYCRQRGDAPSIVITKASDLLWIVRRLSVYPDLHVTIDQIRAVVVDGQSDEGSSHHKLESRRTRKRLITLRHACACRLVAEGLSLKEIGDHLGHRSTSATCVYAKVDLLGLREVAVFDLGELS